MKRRVVAVLCASGLVASACSGSGRGGDTTTPTLRATVPTVLLVARRKVLTTNALTDVSWLTATTLLGSRLSSSLEYSLHEVSVGDGRDRPVHLPDQSDADARPRPVVGLEYSDAPDVLADGRVVLGRAAGVGSSDALTEFVAVDLDTGATERIATLPKADGRHLRVLAGIAWNADHSEGYANLRSGNAGDGCQTIVRLTRDGWKPSDLGVGDAATGWSLGDAARRADGDLCSPSAGYADVSHAVARRTGEITFAATPVARRAAGQDREVDIYSTHFGSGEARTLVQATDINGWALSPDGTLLAWCGRTAGGPWGCRLLAPATGVVVTLNSEPGSFDLAWSADGRSLAVLDQLSFDIAIYDVER